MKRKRFLFLPDGQRSHRNLGHWTCHPQWHTKCQKPAVPKGFVLHFIHPYSVVEWVWICMWTTEEWLVTSIQHSFAILARQGASTSLTGNLYTPASPNGMATWFPVLCTKQIVRDLAFISFWRGHFSKWVFWGTVFLPNVWWHMMTHVEWLLDCLTYEAYAVTHLKTLRAPDDCPAI